MSKALKSKVVRTLQGIGLACLLLISSGQLLAKPVNKTKRAPMLVPPPPPITPITGMYIYGGSDPQFMSLGDLKRRRQELTDELSVLRRQAGDSDQRLKARSDKAKLFVTLFGEGVVSKRELEAAQDDVTRFGDDNDALQRKLSSRENEIARVESKISELSKSAAKPAKKNVAKSSSKSGKKVN